MGHRSRFLLCRSDPTGDMARWALLVVMVVVSGLLLLASGVVQRNGLIGGWGIFGCMILAAALCVVGALCHALTAFGGDQERALFAMVVAWPLVWMGLTWVIVSFEGNTIRHAQAVATKSHAEEADAEAFRRLCLTPKDPAIIAVCRQAKAP